MDSSIVSRHDYNRHLERARSSGNYFYFCRSFLSIMKRDLALFVQDVINLSYKHKNKNNGWFPVSEQDLINSLDWERRTQHRFLSKLIKMKILEMRQSGMPKKRELRIDMFQLENLLDKAEGTVQTICLDSTVQDCLDSTVQDCLDCSKSIVLRNKESNPARTSSDAGKGKKMGFFTVPDKKVKTIFFQMTQELRDSLTKNGKIQKWNKTKWAKELSLLHSKDKQSIQQIQETLDWYNHHLKDVRALVVNASHFRRYFLIIQSLMQKDQKTKVEITKETNQIIENLYGLQWPKGSKDQLPAAIQTTLNSFQSFRDSVQSFADKHPKKKERFAHILVYGDYGDGNGAYLPSPKWTTEDWFRRVHQSVANWKEWSGNLMSFAWQGDLTDRKFNQWGSSLSQEWSGTNRHWNELIRRLKDES